MKTVKKIVLIAAFATACVFSSYAEGDFALEFNGINSYVEIPDSDDWCFGDGNFTIEFWMQFGSPAGHTIMGQGARFDNPSWWFIFAKFDGGLRSRSRNGRVPSGSFWVTFMPEFSLDTWYHLAFVRNEADWAIFVDGVRYAAATWIMGDPESVIFGNANNTLNIGGNLIGPVPWGFQGSLDEIRFWDEAMTAEEVNSWMYRDADGTEAHLKACWNFDEESGDTVYDLTDNNNDGTIHGDLLWVPSTVPQKRHFLHGDFNLNGILEADDYSKVTSNFGNRNVSSYLQGDITGDGRVDLSDFSILRSEYGSDNRVQGTTTLFYDGGDLIVRMRPDAYREVYVYQDGSGLFTMEELLEAAILHEGDFVIEVSAAGEEEKYDYLGNPAAPAPIAGSPDAQEVMFVSENKSNLAEALPSDIQFAGYPKRKKTACSTTYLIDFLRWR